MNGGAWVRLDGSPRSIAWLVAYFVDTLRAQLEADRDFTQADIERACRLAEVKLRAQLTPARVLAYVQRHLVVDGVH